MSTRVCSHVHQSPLRQRSIFCMCTHVCSHVHQSPLRHIHSKGCTQYEKLLEEQYRICRSIVEIHQYDSFLLNNKNHLKTFKLYKNATSYKNKSANLKKKQLKNTVRALLPPDPFCTYKLLTAPQEYTQNKKQGFLYVSSLQIG